MKPTTLTLLDLTLYPAPEREANLLAGLMRYKENTPKYLIEGDEIIGLNLANTGLTNEKWEKIMALPNIKPAYIRALNLSDNQLTSFVIPDTMRSLVYLNLSGNQLKEFSLPPGNAGLIDLNIEENPLTFPPEEILKQGNAAVLRYLKELLTQGEREVYEVKMLIVGEGGTGKTTLWNKLQNPDHPVPDDKQLSTIGIGIKEGWDFTHLDHPQTKFLVNLWDFGGQEIQYMTHQFFLTRRSLYVLLADGRREIANFSYWFKVIDLLGTEPNQIQPLPVLVILNERGNPIAKMPYDPSTVKTDFPRLDVIKREVDFAKKDDRLEALPRAIQEILCHQIAHLPLKIPAYWEAVRKELYELRNEKNYIDFNTFKAICTRNKIAETDEVQMTDLSQLLHDLGVVLHFHEDLSLRDFIVLNPEWAVNAVYEILRHEEVQQNQGRFDQQMLESVWKNCGYTHFEQKHLLYLMRKDNFEVCFLAVEHGRDIYIAPQLLPNVRPANLKWSSSDVLLFDLLTNVQAGNFSKWLPSDVLLRYAYQYPFMPSGIIGRLIVRLHEYLETVENKKMVWKKGMLINKDYCRAFVQETNDINSGLNLIKIEVSGGQTPEDRRLFLRDIRQELDRIHRRSFPSLKYEEKVPCCCARCLTSDDPHFFDLSILKEREQKPKKTIECVKSGTDVAIQALLGGVFPSSEIAHIDKMTTSFQPKKLFFSYSKDDRSFLNELLKHLSPLKRSDKVRPWEDSQLLPGEDWDKKIKNELATADIILLLVSSNALNTDYIWDTEMRRALERDKNGEARVIPVILKPCDWEETPLGVLSALPSKAKPVTKWEDREEAWLQVVKGIKRVIEDLNANPEKA